MIAMEKYIFLNLLFFALFLQADIYNFHLSDAWYPSSRKKLKEMLRSFKGIASSKKIQDIGIIVVPHGPYKHAGMIVSSVYQAIDCSAYQRIILLTSSHHVAVHNVILPPVEMTGYKTPLGVIDFDMNMLNALQSDSLCTSNPLVYELEHAIELQIPFIQTYCKHAKLVPIIIGTLDPESLRQAVVMIQKYLDHNTLLIISADFFHYSQLSTAKLIDRTIVSQIAMFDQALIDGFYDNTYQQIVHDAYNAGMILTSKSALFFLWELLHLQEWRMSKIIEVSHQYCASEHEKFESCFSYVGLCVQR